MAGVIIGSVLGAVVAPTLMVPALGAVGFSALGPVAGSLAATAQSAGAVGAVFSTLQSAAMGGAGMAAVSSVFTGVGAVVGAAIGYFAAEGSPVKRDGGDGSSEDTK
ncbi:hypothetical protein PG993_010923 [Apiospora rasikravindrae]|uniref:Uncharacterized protein n=1 Tax=Apiospora rasikravindrae TaxID=990691 RepID=A0ABR1SCS9_9PEZI